MSHKLRILDPWILARNLSIRVAWSLAWPLVSRHRSPSLERRHDYKTCFESKSSKTTARADPPTGAGCSLHCGTGCTALARSRSDDKLHINILRKPEVMDALGLSMTLSDSSSDSDDEEELAQQLAIRERAEAASLALIAGA